MTSTNPPHHFLSLLCRNVTRVLLPPGPFFPSLPRPCRDLAPIPEAALTFAPDRLREAVARDDPARSLMAHAEELGDNTTASLKIRARVGPVLLMMPM
jgi:hypothetical protein